ncbi:MAG: hypothetical protein H6807_00735 [Planctomycetes bacterium]|nr:hypothetical protein [Planctomycetota bacterium]
MPETPDKNAILALPLLARVAFACRCATRVRDVIRDDAAAVVATRARLVAELVAVGGVDATPAAGAAAWLMAIASLASAAAGDAGRAVEAAGDMAARAAFESAADTARAAARACERAASDAATDAAYAADEALRAFTAAAALQGATAGAAGDDDSPRTIAAREACRRAIWRDYECILDRSRREGWSDHSPVSQDHFGEMWPEG